MNKTQKIKTQIQEYITNRMGYTPVTVTYLPGENNSYKIRVNDNDYTYTVQEMGADAAQFIIGEFENMSI